MMANKKKTKALTTIKGELTAAPNQAVALSVARESELTLDQELSLLNSHLTKLTESDQLFLPQIVSTIDAISAVEKARQRLERLYGPSQQREFHELAVESLEVVLKFHKRRMSLKDLRGQLEASIPEQTDGPLTKSLSLLRRLQSFAGKENVGAAIALSHSSRKLIPLLVAARRKRGELLNSKEFIHACINPTIKEISNCLNAKFSDDVAASIIQDFTQDLSSKMG